MVSPHPVADQGLELGGRGLREGCFTSIALPCMEPTAILSSKIWEGSAPLASRSPLASATDTGPKVATFTCVIKNICIYVRYV